MSGAGETGAGETGAAETRVRLDALRPEDAPRCAALERVLFPGEDPWSEQAFRDELAAGAHYVAARVPDGADGELLVGYAGLAVVGSPPHADAEVHTIGVDPDVRGRGIGRVLLQELLAVADAVHARVFLEVRTDNEVAHNLYESEGFAVVGLRRRYYQPSGADAHTMRREARP